MNDKLKELAIEAGFQYDSTKDIWFLEGLNPSCDSEFQRFFELVKQEICDELKKEFVDDAEIDETHDAILRACYRSYNEGIVDALERVRQFGD